MAQSLNTTFVVNGNDTKDSLFSKDSLTTGDSTRSLLTPLYASDNERSLSGSYSSSSTSSSDSESSNGSSSTSHSNSHARVISKKEAKSERLLPLKPVKPSIHGNKQILTKSWEEWLIEKAVDDLKKLQTKRESRWKKKIEVQQRMEEKKQQKIKESENRERWLSEKNYEHEKKKKEEAAQKEYEQLKEKQKMELIQSKSKLAYEKWIANKTELMKQQKMNEKQLKMELHDKEMEKRKCNEEAYKNWLQKSKSKSEKQKSAKKKKRSNIEDYYEKMNMKRPGYFNPVAWKGVLDDSKSRKFPKRFKERTAFQSPPLLWKDYEERSDKTNKKL